MPASHASRTAIRSKPGPRRSFAAAGNLPDASCGRSACESFTGAFRNPPNWTAISGTVDFGADADQVSFAGEAARLPVINADCYLNKLVTGYCEDVLSRRKGRSSVIQADVENAIAALLPNGQARIENVADKLGVSPRTLRRKLAAEGVTFAGVLEDLRFALARHYLAEQDVSISRIAWLLGYTEVSSFSHAFRRWTGRTPRADRSRRQRPATPGRVERRARRR